MRHKNMKNNHPLETIHFFSTKQTIGYPKNATIYYQTVMITLTLADDLELKHYSGVIMSLRASQITGVTIVCSTGCSGTDKRKHPSSASLALCVEFTGDRDNRRIFPCGRSSLYIQCIASVLSISLWARNGSKLKYFHFYGLKKNPSCHHHD